MAATETPPWPSVSDEEPTLTTMRRASRSLVRSVTGFGVDRLGVDTTTLSIRRRNRIRSITQHGVRCPFLHGLRHVLIYVQHDLGVFLHGWDVVGHRGERLGRVVRKDVRRRWSWWVPNQRPHRVHHRR